MPDKVGIMRELEAHIDYIPEGTLGRLLADARRLIVSQGKELEEVKRANTALTASETMYIERLKTADAKIKPRKRAKT